MGLGRMNGFADIVETRQTGDAEGFVTSADAVLASVRVYREGRHGGERWADMARFSEATDLFRFRAVPGLAVTPEHALICGGERFRIISARDVRGVYTEVLAEKTVPVKAG